MLSDEWALILTVLNNSSLKAQEGLLHTEDIAVWKGQSIFIQQSKEQEGSEIRQKAECLQSSF